MDESAWMNRETSTGAGCERWPAHEVTPIIDVQDERLCRTVPNDGHRLASAVKVKTHARRLDLTAVGRCKIVLRLVSGDWK